MTTYQLNTPTLSEFAERFILKFCFEHNGLKILLRNQCWQDDDCAYALGFPEELVESLDEEKTQFCRQALKTRYHQLKQSANIIEEDWEQAEKNIAVLQDKLRLSDTEIALLRLALHFKTESSFNDIFEYQSEAKADLRKSCKTIAKILNLNDNEVRKAIRKDEKLRGYGLIEFDHSPNHVAEFFAWGEMLDIDHFCAYPLDEKNLLNRCVSNLKEATLQLSHFDHIDEMRAIISHYLQSAIKNRQKGVNILIYGTPGTGKTEFAGLIAKQLNLSCYAVTATDRDGDVLNGQRRLESCRLAQTLLSQDDALLVFDEIEDIFSSSSFERSVAQSHKAWINQFLENNNVPMIWISNSVSTMDNAFLRRFDLVLEMPDLPIKNKAALIRTITGNQLTEAQVQHFAQVRSLTPAILTRGLNVANCLANLQSNSDYSEQATCIFNQTLQAQGFKKIDKLPSHKLSYNLDFVSCNNNIHKISQGLKRTKQGRICCYGPPGTGKTEWAKWLATELDMPLLQCQGSDLLGMYVGETEQKIAAAFNQATENNMLLVFDEVDSFLFNREGANRNWERSMVNEMLTQIEKFEGVLVVSTNLMTALDPAVLRRFDLKMYFDYLKPQQISQIAHQQAKILGFSLQDTDFMQLERIGNLTLGDFTAVARQHKFAQFDNTQQWIEALNEECKLKPENNKRGIGF